LSLVNGIVTGMTLPGGWHFPEKLRTGQTVKIEGSGYHDLESRVLEFRLRQIDLVTPNTSTREKVQEDLREYVCTNFPNWCAKPSGPPVESAPIVSRPFYPLINRLSEWYSGFSYRSLEFVDAAESNRRANICVNCPHNCDFKTGCAPCNKQVHDQSFLINAGRRVQNEPNLQGCRIFGHHLPTAVWLKDTFSVAQHDRPSFCWKTS
jgi:hypothetical protein